MRRKEAEPGEGLDEAGNEGRYRRYAQEQPRLAGRVWDEAPDRLRAAAVAVVQDADGAWRVET